VSLDVLMIRLVFVVVVVLRVFDVQGAAPLGVRTYCIRVVKSSCLYVPWPGFRGGPLGICTIFILYMNGTQCWPYLVAFTTMTRLQN